MIPYERDPSQPASDNDKPMPSVKAENATRAEIIISPPGVVAGASGGGVIPVGGGLRGGDIVRLCHLGSTGLLTHEAALTWRNVNRRNTVSTGTQPKERDCEKRNSSAQLSVAMKRRVQCSILFVVAKSLQYVSAPGCLDLRRQPRAVILLPAPTRTIVSVVSQLQS